MSLVLERANRDLVCFCECASPILVPGGQFGCPQCGCGWLWTCHACRKAVAFGRAVESSRPFADIARESVAAFLEPMAISFAPPVESVESELRALENLSRNLVAGRVYAYFDGHPLDVDRDPPPVLNGIHGVHRLAFVPQRNADSDPHARAMLESRSYWDRARAARGGA